MHKIQTLTGTILPTIRTIRQRHCPRHHILTVRIDDTRTQEIILSGPMADDFKRDATTRKIDLRAPCQISVQHFRSMDQKHQYMVGVIHQNGHTLYCPNIDKRERGPWVDSLVSGVLKAA